jgi:hypothetical protein
MRLVLSLVSLLIISLLLLKGYSGGGANAVANPVGDQLASPIQKANDVNQLVQDTAIKQRQELEKQLQQ